MTIYAGKMTGNMINYAGKTTGKMIIYTGRMTGNMTGKMISYDKHFSGKMLLDQCKKCFYVRYDANARNEHAQHAQAKPGGSGRAYAGKRAL